MKKKDCLSLGRKLTPSKLKNVLGGTTIHATCVRKRLSDGGYYFFSTDSLDVAAAWEDVWNANSDWVAHCYITDNTPTIPDSMKEC